MRRAVGCPSFHPLDLCVSPNMRIPVFARRTNPSIDPPLVRKSLSYGEEQVARGLAYWVDAADPRQGILCRELFQFAPPAIAPEPAKHQQQLNCAELPGLHFRPPLSASRKRRAFPRFFGDILKPVSPVESAIA